MDIIEQSANKYRVYRNGINIGTVVLSHNPYHKTNCYVTLKLNCFDLGLSKKLFDKLKEITGCPLQVMVASDNVALTEFLTVGGFICKRRCYEVEVGLEDYIGEIKNVPLCSATTGASEYDRACKEMYAHYIVTHEKINPWTGDYKAFCEKLPETVLYIKSESEISACAFIEGNEIAYVCGRDGDSFKKFAQCLLTFLLSKYKTVCFESDDCDWAAMILRSLFQNLNESSYDTYIYDS